MPRGTVRSDRVVPLRPLLHEDLRREEREDLTVQESALSLALKDSCRGWPRGYAALVLPVINNLLTSINMRAFKRQMAYHH